MITGPSFQNIQWRTYIGTSYGFAIVFYTERLNVQVFASLNALIVPCVYFFFPGKPPHACTIIGWTMGYRRNSWKVIGRWVACGYYDIWVVDVPYTEDMNVIFALAYNEGISPVEVSLRKDIPLSGSPEAVMILDPDPRGDKSSSREGQERK